MTTEEMQEALAWFRASHPQQPVDSEEHVRPLSQDELEELNLETFLLNLRPVESDWQ